MSMSLRFTKSLFPVQGSHPGIYYIILLLHNIMSFWLSLKWLLFTGQCVGGGHVIIYKSKPVENTH